MRETNIFKVLADSQRRAILMMLRNERLNAGEIAEKLQITPAALSYHLKLLKNADLISEYKEKNFVYYEINTTVFDELIIWVNQFGGKKVMWIVAMIPVVVTSVVLQFMPDIIPMHHDLEGNTDRWGSKTESFIFPVIILFITLFWHLLIYVFEKKSKNANTEKEQMEAKSSAKVLCVVGISQAIMFGIMHYFILYSSWIQANAGGEHAVIDIAKVSCILCGIIFIVLGNFMTKAKRNAVVGVRTVWSMHNDNTWRKSNRFGAICIIITGLLTIITTVFTSGMTGTIFMLIYLLLETIVTVVYSKKIYDKEIEK